MRNLSILILFLFICFGATAQEKIDSLDVYFRQSYGIYEPGYNNNRKNVDAFIERVKTLQQDSMYKISKLSYLCVASASPEGERSRNEYLTKKRTNAITAHLHQYLDFNDENVEVILLNEDYDGLTRMVEQSDMPYREQVLDIMYNYPTSEENSSYNPRKGMLIWLHNGEAWRYMLEHFFPALRRFQLFVTLEKPQYTAAVEYPVLTESEEEKSPLIAEIAESKIAHLDYIEIADGLSAIDLQPISQRKGAVSAVSTKRGQADTASKDTTATTTTTTTATTTTTTTEKAESVAVTDGVVSGVEESLKESDRDGWEREILVKSNAVGWAMFVSNAAFEIDIAKHFSFNLPIYYSGINYFSRTTKFRMFGVYPEFRYWFKERDGLFVGVHAGMAYYNFALGGDWRVQDKGGNTPAWGGGINVGYRMPLFKRNPRWKVEFTLGAGVYDVHYERFVNTNDGPKDFGSVHKTAVALDNVGVNFSYSFGLKKRNKR